MNSILPKEFLQEISVPPFVCFVDKANQYLADVELDPLSKILGRTCELKSLAGYGTEIRAIIS
jgi:hypothetical protein